MRITRRNQNNALAAGCLSVMASCLAMGFTTQAATPEEIRAPAAPNHEVTGPPADKTQSDSTETKPAVDRTGKRRFGKASFYADRFAGRKMADGNRMDPKDDNAASRTLPLGTTAKVTNLKTGKSAVVTIQDRGPYVDGRIVDLSPATAEKIGLSKREGITKVVVAPIAVPMPDGRIKLGAAASDPELAINVRDKANRGPGGGG